MPKPPSAQDVVIAVSGALNDRSGKLGLPPMLRKFWIAIVGLCCFSALYSFVMIKVVHEGYPYNIPYFYPHTAEKFHWDFTVFAGRYAHFHQPTFWNTYSYPLSYPAAVAAVFAMFYMLPHPVWCYVSLLLAAVALGAWAFTAQLIKRGVSRGIATGFVLTLVVTSWPLMFLLQRANIEGFVVLLISGALLASMRRYWWVAATLIGVAGAMKIFPLVILGLPLARRRYREFAWGLLVALLVTLASLKFLGPDMVTAQRNISAGLLYFERDWALNTNVKNFFFDHSLYAMAKIPVIALYRSRASGPVTLELRIYMALAAIGGIALYFLVIRKLPMLNQILALVLCAIMLPPVSYDYTLTHLLLPFGLLCLYAVEEWRQGRGPSAGLAVCFGMFALIFTDLQWVNFYLRFSGQARAVAMMVLLVTVMRFPFRWEWMDRADGLV